MGEEIGTPGGAFGRSFEWRRYVILRSFGEKNSKGMYRDGFSRFGRQVPFNESLGMMISFNVDAKNKMIAIGEKGFPHEICGLMLGKSGETKVVLEIFECGNLNKLKPETRYDMDPKDYLKGEALARQKGLDVIGIF